MPAIVVKAHGGMRPAIEPHLLDPAEAAVSNNTRLITGGIDPLLGTTTLKALSNAAAVTIWRYGDSATETNWWFEGAVDTDFMRSPIPNDAWGRAYWTDGTQPKYGPNSVLLSGGGALPGGSFNLGVPAPAAMPTLTFTPDSTSNSETRSYVYTYVTAYGEEGPPSPPTSPVSLLPTDPVTVAGMSAGPGGPYNITLKRIYRTSTVGSTAQFQFVAEIPVATTSYVDTISQALLGEVIPSEDWIAPPAGLRGLKMLANGAAIGFVGNTVYLSEPSLPHAWPHRIPIEDTIVAIGVFGESAVLLTNGHPYLLSGADPSAMTPSKYAQPQACVAKRAVVDCEQGTIYPSADGLVVAGPGGSLEVVTRKLLTAAQWRAYNPSSMIAAYIDGKYHCLYTTAGGQRGMLIFDFSGEGAVLSTCSISALVPVNAVYADPRSDTLYMAQGGNIVRHDRGSPLVMTRRSGEYRLPAPVSMAVIAVDAAAYPVTARVYADGVLVHTAAITTQFAQRLPAGFEARSWYVELEASAKITRWALATSISELKAAM